MPTAWYNAGYMADGRPTDYDAVGALQRVSVYMQLCKEQTFLPTVAVLAVQMGVARSTVFLWAKEHREFSDILELLLSQQESQLIQRITFKDIRDTLMWRREGPASSPSLN